MGAHASARSAEPSLDHQLLEDRADYLTALVVLENEPDGPLFTAEELRQRIGL